MNENGQWTWINKEVKHKIRKKNRCDENQVSVKQLHSNQYDAFKSIILVWLSGDSSLQMMRYWNTQFSLELQCVHVFV